MTTAFDPNLLKKICDGLDADGYAIIDDAFPIELLYDLQLQVKLLDADQFKSAGVGRATDFQTNSDIRSDHILWLDDQHPENLKYFNWSEALRLELNQQFYLGLADYECMFAHYSVGAFYQKHVDAFKRTTNHQNNHQRRHRKISTILYLNPDWQAADGGELLLYKHAQQQPFKRVLPQLGRLVVFLSEDFPHEVLPANRSRFSLTGWFRCCT